MKKKVMVAMSGGVDSTVVAALLLEQGYEVIGVTMKTAADNNCDLEAKVVAYDLGIAHYVLNAENDFQQIVINDFFNQYTQGCTPNPCIICNKKIKFEIFKPLMQQLQMDYFATGHYANVVLHEGRYLLKKADFLAKDQSYVLYSLNQQTLAQIMFPLGGYTKNQVREIAKKFNLTIADKPDSQDICFIPDGDYRGYITQHCPAAAVHGDMVNLQGQVVAEHQGLPFYTIGQRKGLGIALGYPAYVVALDYAKNRVVIGKEEDLYRSEAITINNNFLLFEQLEQPMKVAVKIRYKSNPVPATIYPLENQQVKIIFQHPEKSVTPGQAGVFYLDDLLIGGGTII